MQKCSDLGTPPVLYLGQICTCMLILVRLFSAIWDFEYKYYVVLEKTMFLKYKIIFSYKLLEIIKPFIIIKK